MPSSPPFAEQTVTFLYTDDLERHAAFYRDLLGLEQVLDQGDCRIFRAGPASFVGVCDKPNRPRGAQGVMLTFLCEDADAVHAALSARGVAFDGPPADLDEGRIRAAFFRDPEGYVLEVQEFRDPRWPYPEGRTPRAPSAAD